MQIIQYVFGAGGFYWKWKTLISSVFIKVILSL